jgi:hypothetical protein
MFIQHTNATEEALARISAAPATSEQGKQLPASEATAALLELLQHANHDTAAILAQLAAAPDLSDHARQLGLRLQRLLGDAERTALALGLAHVVREAGAIAAALDKIGAD